MPKEIYGDKVYPTFSFGYGYLFCNFIVENLLDGIDSFTGYVIYIDDLFITGIISEIMGIKRYGTDLIGKSSSCSNSSGINKMALVYGCGPRLNF